MKNIARALLLTIVILAVFANNAMATAVLFDYDVLPYLSRSISIEAYMEDIYGSDITVTHAIVGNGVFPSILGPDHYIQNVPILGPRWFSISFNEVPITSVLFDWGVGASAFTAYADDIEIFRHGYSFWSSGTTETFFFEAPVTTLKFKGSCLCFKFEVDDLIVTTVPEPAIISLLGLGVLVLLRKQRF